MALNCEDWYNSITFIGHTYEDPLSLHPFYVTNEFFTFWYIHFFYFQSMLLLSLFPCIYGTSFKRLHCHVWLVKMKENHPNLRYYLRFLKSQCETELKAQDAEKWKPLVRYNYENKDWPIIRKQLFTIFCSLTEVLTIFTNYYCTCLFLNLMIQ